MAELSTAPVQGLADGGYLAAFTDDATPSWTKLPVADVEAGVALATTALQPDGVGSAAYLDAADLATNAELAAANAALVAQMAAMQAQIDALAALVGAGEVVVFASDVYEPGVYV